MPSIHLIETCLNLLDCFANLNFERGGTNIGVAGGGEEGSINPLCAKANPYGLGPCKVTAIIHYGEWFGAFICLGIF